MSHLWQVPANRSGSSEQVTTSTTPTDPDVGEPPANGTYWTVTIVATAMGEQTFDINPFDFYLRNPAGNRWDAFDGNAIFESTDNDLQATTLKPGETVRGTAVFDAPRRNLRACVRARSAVAGFVETGLMRIDLPGTAVVLRPSFMVNIHMFARWKGVVVNGWRLQTLEGAQGDLHQPTTGMALALL